MPSETLAFSPELARQAMLAGVVPPAGLVTKAFRNLDSALGATVMKFFAHEGCVLDERELQDHDAQARARDQVFSIAGLYAPRSATPAAFAVAVEIDPVSGVIRVVAGHGHLADSASQPREITTENPAHMIADHATEARVENSVERQGSSSGGAPGPMTTPPTPQSATRRARRGIPSAGGTRSRSRQT